MTLDDLIQGERAHQRRRLYQLVRSVVLVYVLVAGTLAGRMLALLH